MSRFRIFPAHGSCAGPKTMSGVRTLGKAEVDGDVPSSSRTSGRFRASGAPRGGYLGSAIAPRITNLTAPPGGIASPARATG